MLEIINHGKIREIRLARPPVNALHPELVKLLTQTLRETGTECGAVVLSGRDGVFSAGLDVVELLQLDRQGMMAFWGAFIELLETIALSRVPVASAITGHSPAGGAVMCLMSDYRVMSRGDYLIGLNETRVGVRNYNRYRKKPCLETGPMHGHISNRNLPTIPLAASHHS